MKRNTLLYALIAIVIFAFVPNIGMAQWLTTGNTGIGATNYLGTQNNAPLRIATNAGAAYTNLADLRMIVMQDGSVGIGRGDGTEPPTTPLNKLLVENGDIYSASSAQGDIYARLAYLMPLSLLESDMGIISYSNNNYQDANNLAIVGYAQNPLAAANVGLVGASLDGQTNVGTLTSGMQGLSNIGIIAHASVDSPNINNSANMAIQASARGENGADNTGIELDVTGRTNANSNLGISIDIAGDDATNNQGLLLNIDAGGSGTDNSGYNTTISGASTSNSNTAFNTNISCNTTNQNVGAFMNVTGTAGNSNRGYVTTISGASPTNTGGEIYVSNASGNNTGQQVRVTGGGTYNNGLDIIVENTTANNHASGMTISVSGVPGNASARGAGVYAYGDGIDWASGVFGVSQGAAMGNAGVFGSADGIDDPDAWNIGVQGEVLNPGNYLNYAVYGDYVVGGNNGTDYAGFFNGDVFSVTNFYTSDPKLKENIKEYKGALEQLSKIDIKKYTYRTKEFPGMNLPQGEQVGLLSTNLKEVFPNLVKQAIYPGSMRGKEDVKFDAVNTNALVPVLVQAVKELDAKNASTDEMKKEIEALKADKAAMNKELEAVKTDNETLKKEMAEMK